MKDMLGNALGGLDRVVVLAPNSRTLVVADVVRVTPQGARVRYTDHRGVEHQIARLSSMIVKVPG